MVMKLESSRVMTVKELSDYLKVHPSTVYRQLKRGGLPAFKVGSDWRFNIESIDPFFLILFCFEPRNKGESGRCRQGNGEDNIPSKNIPEG
jgi:excisionase family DNA binding protein